MTPFGFGSQQQVLKEEQDRPAHPFMATFGVLVSQGFLGLMPSQVQRALPGVT